MCVSFFFSFQVTLDVVCWALTLVPVVLVTLKATIRAEAGGTAMDLQSAPTTG